MKHLRLLVALLTLFTGGGNLFAQEDITSQYLTNADLSTVDNGWTYFSDTYKYQDWKTDSKVPVVEFYAGWGSLEHKNFKFSQTITLPAGDYRISVNAFYREGNNGNGTNDYKAWIFAGETKKNVYALNSMNDLSAWNSEGTDIYKAAAAFKDGNYANAFDFSLEEESEISLGFEGKFTTVQSWCILGPVKLYKYSLEDYLVDYRAKVAEAQALYDSKMNAEILQALKDAVIEESTFTLSSEIIAATNNLTTAISNANTSIQKYTELKNHIDEIAAKTELLDADGKAAYNTAAADAIAAYNDGTATDGAKEIAALNAAFNAGVLATKQPGNGLDMTAYITNPTFDDTTDGWTTETPYGGNCGLKDHIAMEYWAGNASNRAEASFNIYQELNNLPAGVYTVSADMYNSLNGEGGEYTEFEATCGVYGLSSNEEVALVTEDGTTLKTYTTGEVLVFRGKMTIGTKNTITPIAARWFLFDNVKLTYARQLTQEEIDANAIPESISLDQTDLSMKLYGTATLTPTILPENAADKTVTWTSSNETVATVSNGIVTAVGFGSATITATANGADGLSATATVTVTDVDAAVAPAYYSEIAAGDFYIVNAATGKYLGGANSWGTQASLIEHGIPFTVALTDGKYTLDSHTYNNANDHFFSGTYVDGSSTNLYITSVGNGKYSISTAESSAFVTATPGSTVVANTATNASSVLAQWYFLSKTDRDKMLAAATAEKPADATYYIKQANISRNLSSGNQGDNAWDGLSTGGEQDNSNLVAQVWDANVNISQTIDNIPNGTYTLTMQGFTSGTDVKLYANDVEVDVRANDSGAASCSAAAALFAQKQYPNTLTVTVTDRTLKIGLKGDCSNTKWLCYDDFELMMTNYVPVTGVTAKLEEDVQIGQTATITAATVPAEASFNKLTFASADESIATVDENGVVTGIAVGETTITVTADEMENFSATVNVAVTLVTPTALTMSEEEVELNSDNNSATLTVTATPEGANNVVTWSSSDESVATVADGVVTGISTGTATITATSIVDPEVTATATVTVTYPESTVPETSYENDGATRTVYTLGENLIKNGVFEYPDAFYGWTSSNDFNSKITSDNFTVKTDEGGQKYLVGTKNTGATGVGSLGTAWKLEQGKTYQFAYDVKKEGNGNDFTYIKTSLVTSPSGDESKTTSRILGYPSAISSNWTTITYSFTAGENENYLQVSFRWLNNQWGFRNFRLTEVSSTTEGNVDYVTDAIPTTNVGTGAFQYSQDAIDAANALVQGTATVEDVEAAYETLTTLNAPAAEQVFNIIMGDLTWTNNNNATMLSTVGKAITFYAGGRSDAGGYTSQFDKEPNTNLAQAFYFTAAEGKNKYTIYQIDADGAKRYLCTGTVYGGNSNQVRTTTEASKAEVYTITATTTEGVYNFTNSSNINLGAQDAGLYGTTRNNNLLIVETSKPSITINTTAAGWGTTILPFAVSEIPEGVKVYSCSEASNGQLTLVEETTLEANKPYIIEGAWNATLTGDAQGTALTYTEGQLVGTYSRIAAPNGSYILQKQGDKVGFFKVDTDQAQPNVPANRAYLNASDSNAKAFYLGEETNGINAIEALVSGNAEIFNINGVKQNSLQKGINIIKTEDGKTHKIMVK